MAKAQIVIGEMTGGGINGYEYLGLQTWRGNTYPFVLNVSQKCKGVIMGYKNTQGNPLVVFGFDGFDNNLLQITGQSWSYAVTYTDNTISIGDRALTNVDMNFDVYAIY